MAIRSELGRLRRVLVCSPGAEWNHVRPLERERLLVDDTLWTEGAQAEHQLFRRVLTRFLGEEAVLDLRLLLVQALEQSPSIDRSRLIAEVLTLQSLGRQLDASPARLKRMQELTREGLDSKSDPADLAQALICGLPLPPSFAPGPGHELDSLLDPIPNLIFARDPSARLDGATFITSMAQPARWREPLLLRFIARHSGLAELEAPLALDGAQLRLDDQQERAVPTVEGGDILVLNERIVACGWSQRSNLDGVRALARSLRAALPQGGVCFQHLVVARMPRKRATMHLDTIFSLVDRGQALVYPRMLSPGAAQQVTAFVVDLTLPPEAPIRLHPHGAFLDALETLGLPIAPIAAGGPHPLHQDREQWTDGANALALRPGLIVGYERNRRTAAELANHGYRILRAQELVNWEQDSIDELMDGEERALITIPATELTRARGGPHCLTRDLERDPIHGN